MTALALLLGAALSASAHEAYPIEPVKASLELQPGRLLARLEADSIFWIEEVVQLHPMPAAGWPEAAREKVEAYVNAHFVVKAGGEVLKGRLVHGRYRRRLWEVNEEGTFFLRFEYPEPPAGAELSVRADFYEDHRRELLSEGEAPDEADFKTLLSLPGKAPLALTLASPAAAFPSGDARPRPAAAGLAAFGRGAAAALGAAAGYPALIGVALALGAGRPSGPRLARAAAAAAAGLALGFLQPAPPEAAWAAALAGAGAAAARPGAAAGLLADAALAGLGLHWASETAPELPAAAAAFAAGGAGALAGGAALAAALWRLARGERARLEEHSKVWAPELYVRRSRLAATALALAGARGLLG